MTEFLADKITFSYDSGGLLYEISAAVRSGELLSVTESNGSGKTTLLKLCAGLLRPVSGSFSLIDKNVSVNISARDAVAFASPVFGWYRQLTLSENISFYFRGISLSDETLRMLEIFSMNEYLNTRIETFSSGMMQRLTLAAVLSTPAALFLLDEPSAHLDDDGKKSLYEALEIVRRKSPCIIATHDRKEIEFSDRRICLV